VYEGENAQEATDAFCDEFPLEEGKKKKLIQVIEQQLS
jgi:hypothetical protein